MNSKILSVLALVGAVLTSPAAAQDITQPGVGPQLAAPQAADQTQGMALMSAIVLSNGTLFAGWGGGVASTKRDGLGIYSIYFDRKVDGCVPVATASQAGFANIPGYDLPGQRFVIHTRDNNSQLADLTFNLIVFCAK